MSARSWADRSEPSSSRSGALPPAAARPPPPSQPPANTDRVETIRVDPGSLPLGSLLTVRTASLVATTAGGSVRPTMTGDGGRAYVGSPPPPMALDGLFADWTG